MVSDEVRRNLEVGLQASKFGVLGPSFDMHAKPSLTCPLREGLDLSHSLPAKGVCMSL
jgi:hypothetical protein